MNWSDLSAEDTLQIISDFYGDLFKSRKQALCHLFCVIGNGWYWKDGALVTDDSKICRYRLVNHVDKAYFPVEDIWYSGQNRLKKLKADNLLSGFDEYKIFDWYPVVKGYSYIFNLPNNIRADWKKIADECIELMKLDGVDIGEL